MILHAPPVTRLLRVALFLAAPALSAQHNTPPAETAATRAAEATLAIAQADLADGERLFKIHCASCHGPKGEGAKCPTLATPVLNRAQTDELLLQVIRRGVSGTEMASSRLERHEIRNVAGYVRSLGKLPSEPVPGNAARGAQLYATKGACAQCHSLNGEGGAIGPALDNIGLRRGVAHLRTSLTEPPADTPKGFSTYRADVSIPENFLQVRIATQSGEHVAGVRVNEDTFTIQLRDLGGRLHSFVKSDLAELHKDWGQSPMPSYASVFTATELDDLVAYLASLKGSASK